MLPREKTISFSPSMLWISVPLNQFDFAGLSNNMACRGEHRF